jgi:hypothetical protein
LFFYLKPLNAWIKKNSTEQDNNKRAKGIVMIVSAKVFSGPPDVKTKNASIGVRTFFIQQWV